MSDQTEGRTLAQELRELGRLYQRRNQVLRALTPAVDRTEAGPSEIIARHRCQDVHAVRWDVPTLLYDVMDPCSACTSWGAHVAAALPAPSAGPSEDAVLRQAVRGVVREALKQRDYWANRTIDGSIARDVAYQNIAGLLIRALDEEVGR